MSDRKYRHRGYQDDDRDREPQRRQRPKTDGVRKYDGAPRGRGLGAPTAVAFKCARCGKQLENFEISASSNCPSCNSALHSCTNCGFFDTGSRFECRKEIPARIESKGKANECDFFQPKTVRELKAKETTHTANDPRAAFDALFKK